MIVEGQMHGAIPQGIAHGHRLLQMPLRLSHAGMRQADTLD
jgi:hypothetical protein